MIAVLLTLFCAVFSSPISVEFGRDQIPQIISDLEIGEYWTSGIRNILHSGIETRLLSPSLYVYEGPPTLHIPSSIPVSLTAHASHVTGGGDYQYLAIGPGSDMARTFGSVALVHANTDSGFLLLNSTEEEFLLHFCLHNSSIQIPTNVFPPHVNTPQTMGRILSVSNDSVPIRFTPTSYILKVHPNIFEELFDQIPLLAYGPLTTVPNCTEMRSQLPNLQIELTADRMINLTAQDYTRFKQGDGDECDLLIGISMWFGDTNSPVEMNPLLIPGFNSFATDNNFILCEALQYIE